MSMFPALARTHCLSAGILIALSFGIAACSQTGAPASAGNLRVAVPAPGEMVAQVRAATLEKQSDIPGAAQAIAKALTIVPGDPELQQQAAEYALYQQDWAHAAAFAQQSYDRGPKLGALCRRNWTTLRFVRLVHGDATGVQAATEQVATCTIAAPVRM